MSHSRTKHGVTVKNKQYCNGDKSIPKQATGRASRIQMNMQTMNTFCELIKEPAYTIHDSERDPTIIHINEALSFFMSLHFALQNSKYIV